jgi:hypothetical protein
MDWTFQHVQKTSEHYHAGNSEEIYPIFSMEDGAICHDVSSQRLFSKTMPRASEYGAQTRAKCATADAAVIVILAIAKIVDR